MWGKKGKGGGLGGEKGVEREEVGRGGGAGGGGDAHAVSVVTAQGAG